MRLLSHSLLSAFPDHLAEERMYSSSSVALFRTTYAAITNDLDLS